MRTILMLPAAVVSVAAVVGGICAWMGAQDIAIDFFNAARPEVALWAVRSGAIALIALAQMILLTGIIRRIYHHDTFDAVFGLTCAAVFALATVSAIACGVAGR